MQIQDLDIPDALKQQYLGSGIRELYPPQATCVEKGLLDGKNLLVAIPTASGKTLIAEMAMHRHIAAGGKCLYIVPLKALASEKFEEFGNKGVRVGISTGDLDRRDDALGRNDIIVATSEKVDSLLRNSARWIPEITLIVVDEVHLIDSPDRGPTLEMVIAKMRYRNPAMQIIGLSATIGNPKMLAGWLDAELVTSTWRPVDLHQGVFFNNRIQFAEGVREVKQVSKNYDDLNLCLDTIAEGGQCLVFVSSRRNAEAFAKRAAAAIKSEDPALAGCADRLLAAAQTEMVKTLATCVAKGAAFHHAGLSRNERSIVEEAFRKGWIKCISSTPTLAAGLNLPARRVVIRDYLRFSAGEGMQPIPVSEYRQMAGRAGRPRLDPYGEAVLIAKEAVQVPELFACYIEAAADDVHSRIAEPTALYTHVLSLIASAFAKTRDELSEFMNRTFYVHEHRQGRLMHRAVDAALEFLISAEMVLEVGEHLGATELGTLVSRMYIDPRSASAIVTTLREREEYADLGLVQLICSTPDMPKLYARNSDLAALSRMMEDKADELWLPLPTDEEEAEGYYRAVKTAMLLSDWTDELPEEKICERYAVGPGDVYGLVESINWLLHATSQLARMFAPKFYPQINECEICMKNGTRRELLPLIRLRGIGRVRARRLFNNGMTSPEEIKKHPREDIVRILGQGITDQIFEQLEPKNKSTDTTSVNGERSAGQSTLFRFG
ncbi:MAG: ATP-dependent DNA helicase [Methanoregula sp.]|jgi:helicase|uniref:ATP-dependent DNA helicase n=1 Tax=Methanoregula sp. TaxID=2052170 RepID=UPI003D0E8635